MADNCRTEKIAFDRAEGLLSEYEESWDMWERAAVRTEWDAFLEPERINQRCKGKGAECYTEGWARYHDMVEDALRNREAADRSRSRWEQAVRAAERAKEKYHRCLDRQKSR